MYPIQGPLQSILPALSLILSKFLYRKEYSCFTLIKDYVLVDIAQLINDNQVYCRHDRCTLLEMTQMRR